MALMMMVGTFSTVQAKELVGKDHWKVSFDGSQMTTNFGKDQMKECIDYLKRLKKLA